MLVVQRRPTAACPTAYACGAPGSGCQENGCGFWCCDNDCDFGAGPTYNCSPGGVDVGVSASGAPGIISAKTSITMSATRDGVSIGTFPSLVLVHHE